MGVAVQYLEEARARPAEVESVQNYSPPRDAEFVFEVFYREPTRQGSWLGRRVFKLLCWLEDVKCPHPYQSMGVFTDREVAESLCENKDFTVIAHPVDRAYPREPVRTAWQWRPRALVQWNRGPEKQVLYVPVEESELLKLRLQATFGDPCVRLKRVISDLDSLRGEVRLLGERVSRLEGG